VLELTDQRDLPSVVHKMVRSLAKDALAPPKAACGANVNYSAPRAARVAANGCGLLRLWQQQTDVLVSTAFKSSVSRRRCPWLKEEDKDLNEQRRSLLKVAVDNDNDARLQLQEWPLLTDMLLMN